MATENQYSSQLPNKDGFDNISGRKTVRLVCHCPKSKFIIGDQGCDELSAVRWFHSQSGEPIYIDGKGYLYYKGNTDGFCIMDCQF